MRLECVDLFLARCSAGSSLSVLSFSPFWTRVIGPCRPELIHDTVDSLCIKANYITGYRNRIIQLFFFCFFFHFILEFRNVYSTFGNYYNWPLANLRGNLAQFFRYFWQWSESILPLVAKKLVLLTCRHVWLHFIPNCKIITQICCGHFVASRFLYWVSTLYSQTCQVSIPEIWLTTLTTEERQYA